MHQPGGHEHNYQQSHGHQCPGQQCPQGSEEQCEKEEQPESPGFFGYLKSLFGRRKSRPDKGEGETSMIGVGRHWMSSF